MSSTEITNDNFESTILENEIVFLDFWAGPARARRSLLDQLDPDVGRRAGTDGAVF